MFLKTIFKINNTHKLYYIIHFKYTHIIYTYYAHTQPHNEAIIHKAVDDYVQCTLIWIHIGEQ
jgi:hypothetical protein